MISCVQSLTIASSVWPCKIDMKSYKQLCRIFVGNFVGNLFMNFSDFVVHFVGNFVGILSRRMFHMTVDFSHSGMLQSLSLI